MLLPVVLFLLLAFAGPYLLTASPTKQDLIGRLARPVLDGGSWQHPFGTDSLGRDILARIAQGARYSLMVGAIAASGTAVIGITLGMLAGAGGRLADRIITLLADVSMAVPFVVVGIVMTAILGQSLTNVLAILIVSGWVSYARIVRLQTRSLAGSEFVLASVAMGGSRLHIFLRHLLPNLLPILLMLFFQQIAAMMLFEASLTYLGLGLPVERITLGGMVQAGQEQIFNGWWASVFPGIAIALAVVGFNLLADWLQERRDPYRRWT
jgi:peptide/nickel transport system permease protein